MPHTIKLNGQMNSMVHKGSVHWSMATIPDVCKTPSPGGPIPIPYPNITLPNSLAKGTTTVKADGGNMIANKGSEFSMSTGDEPGTAGGVKSSTFKKESTWITYSFDVKIEGKNACRLTDKKFQNHENTVDIMGLGGTPVVVTEVEKILIKMVCDCDKIEQEEGETCMALGDRKHGCVDKKIKARNGRGEKPTIGSEAGWTGDTPPVQLPFDRKQTYRSVRAGTDWPDAVSLDANGMPDQIFDFKFKCPSSTYDGAPSWGRKKDGRSQEEAYKNLTKRWGKDPKKVPPKIISNTDNC